VSTVGKKICFSVSILVLALVTFAYHQRVTISMMYANPELTGNDPWLHAVPRPLLDLRATDDPGTQIKAFGFEFEVPWKGSETPVRGEFIKRFSFEEDRVVALWNPSTDPNFAALLRSEGLSRILGRDAVNSRYSLEAATLNATPHPINLFTPPSESIRQFILLTQKSAEEHRGTVDILSVASHDLRGFQIGDPARVSSVLLLLFDKSDDELEVLVFKNPKTKSRITQGDVNRIIQTIHSTSSH